MVDLSSIVTCFDVTEQVLTQTLQEPGDLRQPSARQKVYALLDHMAAIGKPKQGAVKILLVLSRMATREWIEGDLEVRVSGDDVETRLEIFVNDGLSLQKIRPPLALAVPYEEFRRAISAKAEMLAPLRVAGAVGATKTRLVAKEVMRRATVPPPFAKVEAAIAPRGRSRRPPPRAIDVPPPVPSARARAQTMIGIPEPDLGPRVPEPPPMRARIETVMGVPEPPRMFPPPAEKTVPLPPPPRAPMGTLMGVPEPASLPRGEERVRARPIAPRAEAPRPQPAPRPSTRAPRARKSSLPPRKER